MKRIPLSLALAAVAASAPLAAQGHGHHPTTTTGGSSADAHSPALHAQIEAVRRGTERYRDHTNAVRDGYRRFGSGEGALMGEHWYHPNLVRRPLDLARPSTLQYATIGGERVLVGVAYTHYRRPGEPLPEGFAGADDHWHTHDVARLARSLVADRPLLRGIVDRRIQRGKAGGGEGRTLLTMVHAWVWSDNPDGVFAEEHRGLPYLRAGLPAEWARGAAEASARGVALLAEEGCAREVRRTDAIARLERGQERSLTQACEREAASLRAAVAGSRDARAVNAAAASAWERYETAARRALTPAQHARLRDVEDAAMEPHGM